MKARLNVLGRNLEVVSINYALGEIDRVKTVDELGNYKSYFNEKYALLNGDHLIVDMEEALEFPDLEQRIVDEQNKLIAHLDEIVISENESLTAFAIEAMDDESLPFSELALVNSQKEYKLFQQRVLGFIDAVEEVKAFTEGYYANVDDGGVE